MSIRWRPMRPKDVRPCVEIIASHPIVGPRYAGLISDLRSAWLHYLSSDEFQGCVFEDVNGASTRLLGAGIRAFVSDDFVREIKTPPLFWVGPVLAKRVAQGDSPLLSAREVREANSSGGLNLLFWEACMRYEDSHRLDLLRENGDAIITNHRGFLIKEWIMQASSPEVLQVMVYAGGCSVIQGDGRYAPVDLAEVPELFARPHVIGLTRELGLTKMGSWASNLFVYAAPRFDLRPSEQKLLLAALRGSADEELADELGVSRSAVKKAWSSIYERVAACDPNLLPHVSPDGDNGTARGKAKRHRLLPYLREHPEELRPVSRRLLRSAAVRDYRHSTQLAGGVQIRDLRPKEVSTADQGEP